MEAGAQPLARLRGLSLAPATFRRLAIVNAVMLTLIVVTGATVRLTGSGLGCEHWPGCQPGEFLPKKGYHHAIEFSNRGVAFLTILVALATWIGAQLAATRRVVRVLAAGVFAGAAAQAPLGALTVHYHLNPWLVLSHFLLSLVVLALAVIIVVDLRPRSAEVVPPWARAAALAVAAAVSVLVVSGTLATASGPHAGAQGNTVVPRLWSFESAVYWHVRATAVFGVAFALLLTWLVRRRSSHLRPALIVLALLAAQMAVGEAQYRTQLPWWLVLVHVSIAATVWAAVTTFVFGLWRPSFRPRLDGAG
jgi:cytochrome c oxidase assembly protein subunit 15